MFVDQADITVFAGDGGRGCASFRKEKYIPHGGPDGGDGGDGGSVYLQATPGVDTLLDMTGRHHWKAPLGANGMSKKMAGRDGGDLIIRVPPGTLIYDRTSALLIADLKTPGQSVRIARGGKGGKGNIHFVTSVHQAPDYAEPGQKGEVRELHLELRLIADVGIVGLPNAGKSTLLSHISAARPKIADYPFTTLVPQLGIAEIDPRGPAAKRGEGGRRLVFADIPGLIEGASTGAGLGQDFLRHIERTRVLVHMLDVLPLDNSRPIDSYRQIRAELQAYSPKLAAKPEILVANKMDLSGASEALADLRTELPGKQIYAVSAVSGTGLRPLLEALWQLVELQPEADPFTDRATIAPTEKDAPRAEEDMFQYVEAPADEEQWEPAEFSELPTPEKPAPARGADSAQVPTSPKKKKGRRLLVKPTDNSTTIRRSAKSRKAEHDARINARKTPAAPAPETPPTPAPAPTPDGIDPELQAEIAAIKADDARKSKFYSRRKTDV